MARLVQKYGGTSVADAERIRSVAKRVASARAQGHDVTVVVSAMGKTTDDLIALARSITSDPAAPRARPAVVDRRDGLVARC